jgi:hypothetical protein
MMREEFPECCGSGNFQPGDGDMRGIFPFLTGYSERFKGLFEGGEKL